MLLAARHLPPARRRDRPADLRDLCGRVELRAGGPADAEVLARLVRHLGRPGAGPDVAAELAALLDAAGAGR
jgi:hypothetical protein